MHWIIRAWITLGLFAIANIAIDVIPYQWIAIAATALLLVTGVIKEQIAFQYPRSLELL